MRPVYKRIDTCAAEFASQTPYLYSCYEGDGFDNPECEADPSERNKVIILGGGPNRIGQGIEFDYCCVHAAYSLSEAGIETIMINCNPETVSTDYDTSDRLYFEPLTAEDVIEIVRVEQQARDRARGDRAVRRPNPAKARDRAGTCGYPDPRHLARRDRFGRGPATLSAIADQGSACANRTTAPPHRPRKPRRWRSRIGYPVVIRPSYVLGGRAMEIVHDAAGLNRYMRQAVSVSGTSPVLIDRYLQDAIEVDVDAVSDGRHIEVAGIMEHIEEAGIHSGDSACSLPPYSLEPRDHRRNRAANHGTGASARRRWADECPIRGQGRRPLRARSQSAGVAHRAVCREGYRRSDRQDRGAGDDRRAARGFPTASRGEPWAHVAVKEAVFPFARFPGVDLILGPEMKSTGEVMGLDCRFRPRLCQIAARQRHTIAARGMRIRLGARP